MRISVTDRCNMRCTYCVPKEGFNSLPHEDILSYEEILRVVTLASEVGVNKFRITGGEPLVRRGVIDLTSKINAIDGVETTFTTNGLLLEDMAEELKSAGVRRLNISLDSLNPKRFADITRIDKLDKVLRGIEKAHSLGFTPLKLNIVIMKGVNDDEIEEFVNLTKNRNYHVRFIEFMPMKANGWDRSKFIAADEVETMVEKLFNILPDSSDPKGSPSRNYTIDGHLGKIGFISPVSRHFCDSCNRIRLTSDGHIRSCLLRKGEIDMRPALRGGAGDDEVRELIREAVLLKPSGHEMDNVNLDSHDTHRSMTQIGG
ncbi:MAG: GTP 3',8-cyclase MoaA [Proteobacteria bacterium]|nr:GTP 3',8-cyclase MoaA [Pseudomonadota bacterium]